MMRRFACVLGLILAAAPAGAAEGDPLPKEIADAWKQAKISCGWMGTARSDGAMLHSYFTEQFEPGSFVPGFEVFLTEKPDLAKLPQPEVPFGVRVYFTNAGDLEQLKRFKTLARISIYDCPLGDAGIKILAEMTQLEELRLTACKISPEGFKTLTKLKNLKRLGLRSTKITDAEIPLLKAFEKLEHLEIGENLEVTDKGAPALAELKTLKYLDIYLTRILDEGLKSIAKMTHLRGLHIVNTRATGAGLKSLGALRDLERFHMDGHGVNSETISAVLGMKKLRHLSLNIAHADKTAAGDAEFKKLEAHKDLRELSVFGWQITDASLPAIRAFEKLEFLDLRSTNVKLESAKQLQKDLPKCRIFLP